MFVTHFVWHKLLVSFEWTFVHTLTHLIFTCSCSFESYEIFNAPTLMLMPTLDERLVQFHLEDGIELSLRWPRLDRRCFFKEFLSISSFILF